MLYSQFSPAINSHLNTFPPDQFSGDKFPPVFIKQQKDVLTLSFLALIKSWNRIDHDKPRLTKKTRTTKKFKQAAEVCSEMHFCKICLSLQNIKNLKDKIIKKPQLV